MTWQHSILLFGGSDDPRGVYIFDHASTTWSAVNTSQLTMDLWFSSCIKLQNDLVLISGSNQPPYTNSVVSFDPKAETWTELESTIQDKRDTRLVELGSRIFAIEGYTTDDVEEYVLLTDTWKPVDVKLLARRNGWHSLLALPADMFSHLPGGCEGVE